MRHIILLTLFMLSFLPTVHAQQVKNVVATANNDMITVTCELETDKYCILKLQYSDNNGLTWNECKTIEGDIVQQASGKKTIQWNCLKDNVLMGSFIFKVIPYPSGMSTDEENNAEKSEVRTEKPKEKVVEPKKERPKKVTTTENKGSFLVLPGISFGNTMSYSLMAGYVKKWGGYVKVKSSMNGKAKGAIKGDVDDAFFNGNSAKGRFSAYAGTIGQLLPYLYVYAGVGFGNKWLQWETVNNEPMEIKSGTYSGFDPEVGVLFKIKKFTIGGGFNCLIGDGHKNGEGSISVGIIF